MLPIKERKRLILKYLQKHPFSNRRQIRVNHSPHEYSSRYLPKILEEMIKDEKIASFQQKFFVVPKSGKEIQLLISIVKSAPLTKPSLKKLSFENSSRNPTLNTIINNCLCLYFIKLKINNFEKTIPKSSFNSYFIKFLKTFSDDNYYSEFMVDKDHFRKHPHEKIMLESSNTLEKRILNFLRLYWGYSLEYHLHLKNNRISLKEVFNRIFKQYNQGKSVTAEQLGITNKGLKRSLDQLITTKNIYKDTIDFDSEWHVKKSEKNRDGLWDSRPRILAIGLGILGHRTPSQRKKYAKIAEEQTGILYTKLIPLEGISNLLKDAPKDPTPLDPYMERKYVKDLEKKFGVPHIKVIPSDGEPYLLEDESKNDSKSTDK